MDHFPPLLLVKHKMRPFVRFNCSYPSLVASDRLGLLNISTSLFELLDRNVEKENLSDFISKKREMFLVQVIN